MEYLLELRTTTGPARELRLSFPGDKVSLDQLVKPLQLLSDAIVKAESEGLPISCRKGCGVCCSQLVPLAAPEAFHLSRTLERLKKSHKKQVKKRFSLYKHRLGEEGLLSPLREPSTATGLDQTYFDLALPCPFLQDGGCSIYENRPLACREYLVVSNPVLCATPFSSPPEKVSLRLTLGPLLSVLTSSLTGLPRTPVPHILAMEWAEKHTSLLTTEYTYSLPLLINRLIGALNSICRKNDRIMGIHIKSTS